MQDLPSVTRVMHPWTEEDYRKIPPALLEAAQERGKAVHGILAAEVLNLWVPRIPDEVAGYIASFKQWTPYVESWELVEETLVCPTHKFRGRPDIIVRIQGDPGLTIVDYKTPVVKTRAWELQMAAYRHLALVNGYDVRRVGTLRLKKDGGLPIFDPYDPKRWAYLFSVFLNCLTAFNYFRK